jgi:lysophospholipase L1-like esterase
MSIRICFFGDSIVNGTGDDACLGWVGRICSIARRRGVDLTCYNLGVRRDTSTDVLARWQTEAHARLPDEYDGRLVFSFGANDCCPGDDVGGVRVAPVKALANASAVLSAAVAWRPTLMIGPFPIWDPVVDKEFAAFQVICSAVQPVERAVSGYV